MSPRASALSLSLVAAACLASAVPAAAQGFAIDGQVGYQDLTRAKDSAKAVFDGKSGGLTYGGGARYAFKRGLYFGAWARVFKKDGQRVFVADASSPAFPLGHPLSVRIVPIQATIGYRFASQSPLVLYVGAGGGVTSYREESTVGGVTESVTSTKGSAHALAGLEYGRGSLRLAAEAAYATVPNSIGIGGVSKVYGEKDIGGLSIVGKLVLVLGGR